MKFGKLKAYFLSLLVSLALCSVTSKVSDNHKLVGNNEENVLLKEEKNSVLKSANIDGISLGNLNSDLEVSLRNSSTTQLGKSFQVLISFGDAADLRNNYYVGYYGEGDEYLPGSLLFKVKDTNGNIETRSAPINKIQQMNNFDGIGSSLGATSLNTFCDINLAYGEEVLYDESIQLFNVFPYDSETKTVDLNSPTYSECSTTSLTQQSTYLPPNYNVVDYFDLRYTGSSNYQGFGAFSFEVKNYGIDKYQYLSSTTSRAYRTNELDLQSGKSYIKASLSFGGDTQFILTYDDGKVETIDSTVKLHEITNGGQIVLLLEGVDVGGIVNIEIYDIYYQLVIFNTQTNANVSRTTFSQRFGHIYTHMTDLVNSNGVVVVPRDASFNYTNNNLVIGLLFALSTLIFFGSVIPSYFYLKKKNRNDEFKRMNTKSYWTTATYGYLCIESVLLLVAYIAIRATNFNNTLTVFNPTDPYIVVFGVASIILVGYFIKYFAVMVKNNIEKKRRDQLKINQDVIDDGTLIIRK